MATIHFTYPDIPFPGNGSLPAITAGVLDATTDLQGCIFEAEETVTITTVAIRFTAVAGTSTNRVIRAGIVYINSATGFPASTPVWANATFSGSAGTGYAEITAVPGGTPFPPLNVFTEFTLTTAVTIPKGTVFGIVVKGMTGTWSATDSVSVTRGWNTIIPYIRYPYSYEITSGTTLARVNHACPGMYYKTATTTYGYPMQTFSTLAINTTTSPAEAGMTFTIPSTVCSTYKVAGLRLGAQLSTGGFDLVLYSGLTAIQTTSFAGGITHTVNQSMNDLRFDSTLVTLNSGTSYTITIKPTSATNFGTFAYMTFPAANDKGAFLTNPTDIVYVSRNSGGGAFTSNTTRLFSMQLMIEDMAFTSGGGSSATEPRLKLNAGLN